MPHLVTPNTHSPTKDPANTVSLLAIASTFFWLGATTFGGMWAATRQIQRELVDRRGWVREDEMMLFLVAATLIPAPKFLGLGGLIGYRVRGITGCTVAVLSLILPGSLMVLLMVLLMPPTLLSEKLAPVQRSVGIGVVGIVFGSVGRLVRTTKASRLVRTVGVGVGLSVGIAIAAGVPLIIALIAGFALGAILIKER